MAPYFPIGERSEVSIRASEATPENFHNCLDGNALRNSLNQSIGLELGSK